MKRLPIYLFCWICGILPASLTRAQEAPAAAAPSYRASSPAHETLITVDKTELKLWQATMLKDIRLADNVYNSVLQWLDIHLLAQEAKKRNLEILAVDDFYLTFTREQFLSLELLKQIQKDIPEFTDEQAKAWYEDSLQYRQPYLADVQHIRIQNQKKAEEVAAMARKPGADFSELVRTHSETSEGDKRANGFVSNKDITQVTNFLGRYLGEQASRAIENAKPGDILGPIPCTMDYEIIKVIDVQKQPPPPSVEAIREQKNTTMHHQEIQKQKGCRASLLSNLYLSMRLYLKYDRNENDL